MVLSTLLITVNEYIPYIPLFNMVLHRVLKGIQISNGFSTDPIGI